MSNSARPGERTSGFLRSLEIPQALRALVRAREAGLIALAALIGVIAGLVVALMGITVSLMHRSLYGVPIDQRLSAQTHIDPWAALAMPTLGGMLFGLSLWMLVRVRPGREVDPIEANALHGGRMSFRGSLIVALQTVWSSGVGASVGLEAGYTQFASGVASWIGQAFRLRRRDLRVLVGVLAAGVGVTLMRSVALCETFLNRLRIRPVFRPTLGGLIVGGLAIVTPEVMSSGHGAIHISSMYERSLSAIALLFVMKSIASIVSLGTGFRGGLFFASLLIGALGGRMFADTVNLFWPAAALEPHIYAIVGMGALSVAVIGGPLTMTFIALETTGDFWLTTAVLIAIIIAAQVTRETFGYSFATWRFHLRGEGIRSAADVGWIRELTVRRMMRADVKTVSSRTTISRFRLVYPLSSVSHVIAIDEDKRYAGIVSVAEAHAPDLDAGKQVREIMGFKDTALFPTMTIKEAVIMFDHAEAEALAVVDSPEKRDVVGLLTESYALRRYSSELEQRRQEILGE
jgi:CIC family chloride channel protein